MEKYSLYPEMKILHHYSCVSILQFLLSFSCNVYILTLSRDSTLNDAQEMYTLTFNLL